MCEITSRICSPIDADSLSSGAASWGEISLAQFGTARHDQPGWIKTNGLDKVKPFDDRRERSAAQQIAKIVAETVDGNPVNPSADCPNSRPTDMMSWFRRQQRERLRERSSYEINEAEYEEAVLEKRAWPATPLFERDPNRVGPELNQFRVNKVRRRVGIVVLNYAEALFAKLNHHDFETLERLYENPLAVLTADRSVEELLEHAEAELSRLWGKPFRRHDPEPAAKVSERRILCMGQDSHSVDPFRI